MIRKKLIILKKKIKIIKINSLGKKDDFIILLKNYLILERDVYLLSLD